MRDRQVSWGGEGHRCIQMFTVLALPEATAVSDLKLQTEREVGKGCDTMCSTEVSASPNALQRGIMFLGSLTRVFALTDIHWCMKFLYHPWGMKLQEEQEVPRAGPGL